MRNSMFYEVVVVAVLLSVFIFQIRGSLEKQLIDSFLICEYTPVYRGARFLSP